MAIDINVPSQVKTYANLAAFPATGSLKTIFIAEDTNKTYRWTGTAYVEVSAAGATGITIGTTAITSGTVGRVLFEGTGNVVQESTNLFWDNTNGRLGIGGTPSAKLEVFDTAGTSWTRSFGSYFELGLSPEAFPRVRLQRDIVGPAGGIVFSFGVNPANFGSAISQNGTANLVFLTSNGTALTEGMRLTNTRNVLINTTTDAGYKLDVNGTARVKGTGTTSATTAFTVQNSAGSNALTVKDDFSVFIGTTITGSGNNVTDQFNTRLYTYGNGQVAHFIGATVNGGTGDTSLGLFGLGTGGGYYGGIRFFTSSNSATPNLAMIVDRNQSVGIGLTNSTNLTVNASAKLQIDSTTKGFLPPRMDTTQKNAIATPATGLMVYDTTLNLISVYNGTSWITL